MAWNPQDRLAHQVALEVLLHGPLGRAEIARRMDLAPGTLTRISADLLKQGIITEVREDRVFGSGRPAVPLDIVVDARHFLGVKLAADSVTAVLTNLRAEVVDSAAVMLEESTPECVVSALADLVESGWGDREIDAVGVGVGGVVDSEGTVINAPFLGWQNVPLQEMLQKRIGIPTHLENDLEAFTQALHWFGEGAGKKNFATVTLGVGVGFGCVANGQLVAGPDYGVGLVGHWPLDPMGPICSKGHRGCAEAMLTIPMIERDVSNALGWNVLWQEIMDLVRAEDAAALRIASESGKALGQLIGLIANLTAPEVVIIGGEGVKLAELVSEQVKEGIAQTRDERADPVVVLLTSDENNNWARGAAVIAIQRSVLKGLRK